MERTAHLDHLQPERSGRTFGPLYFIPPSALAALFLALVPMGPGTALAQDRSPPSQAAGASDQNTTVDQVVVTARKREETIRDIPTTISAVTAGQLAANGPVSGTGDLLRTVPGVRFNDLQSPNLSEVSIRGSGTQRATGADSGVGLFVNGAYVGSSTLGGRNFKNIDFFDLDRVEVLKGPQGALYGRNSEYGTVNIVTAKPQFKSSGYVDETYTGALDQNRITAVINQPINDEISVRIGGESFLQSGGFYYNPDSGNYYDHTSGWILRGQVRYKHGPLDVNFMYDAQDLDLPTFVNNYVLPAGASAQLPLGYTSDRFNNPQNGVNTVNQKVQRAMLTVDYDFGWSRLTSTTLSTNSISRQNYASAIDLSTEARFQSLGEIGVYPLSQVTTRAKDNTIYEDLHLTGGLLGGRLTWLVGGEVLWQKDSNGVQVSTSPCVLGLGTGICGGTPAAPVCYLILPTSRACPAVFPGNFGSDTTTPQNYLSEAGYGSLKYDIGYGLTVSGELRYTNDDRKATQYAYLLYTRTPTTPVTNYEFNDSRTNYTVTLSYKVPGPWRDLLYAKTGTGYRAGGINNGASSPFAPLPQLPVYGDEDTTSYEAGLKGNLGRNVYFTIAGYFSRTNGAIASITDGCSVLNACAKGPTVFNINAGTVHAHGVEASVDSRFDVFGGRLNLGLNAANQEATYVAFTNNYAGLPALGSAVAQIPDWTASGTLDYAHALTADIDGFFHLVYQGQWGGSQDTVTTAVPFNPLEDYDTVNLRTGVNYRKVQLAFFVQNLTDTTVALLKLQSAGIPLNNRYNQPRTFGVNAVYRW